VFRYIFFFLLISVYAYGRVVEINETLKLDINVIYPDKEIFYVKEPLKIRFVIKSINTPEKLLKGIKIFPEENVVSFSRKKIEKDKLICDYVVFFTKEGKSLLPFDISINTDLIKKNIKIKSEKTFLIVPIPRNTVYVGDFNIKTELEDRGGIATLTIKIEGKGFPSLPRHTLAVRNGSAKKISYTFKNNLEDVYSVEKYKIVYMDELEVKPVKFKFFNPYKRQIEEKETEGILIERKTKKEEPFWKKLPEDQKTEFYIEKFKALFPEEFERKSIFSEVLTFLSGYAYHITALLLISSVMLLGFLYRKGKEQIHPDVLFLLSLKGRSIHDFKKLYRYIAMNVYQLRKRLKDIEHVIYREKMADKKLFDNLVKEIFLLKIKNLPERKRFFLKLLFHVRVYIRYYLVVLVFLFIAITIIKRFAG